MSTGVDACHVRVGGKDDHDHGDVTCALMMMRDEEIGNWERQLWRELMQQQRSVRERFNTHQAMQHWSMVEKEEPSVGGSGAFISRYRTLPTCQMTHKTTTTM